MTRFRRSLTGVIAATALGASALAMSTTPAAAWGRWGGYGWGWGGPAIAAGVIGGLALGAVAASAAPYGYGYGYGYGYPVGYAYPAVCVARQPVFDPWGRFAGYRRVRVAC